ncbi:hypothetical protein [Streptomyces sp. NBC_01233]|uniref:hypothetical protein n=1 Tax=Streptomyces sp. NBC_01233 TaxID=2903787 RepID=UPI002E1293EC|nr:hypothetical protein OG332_17680 [Streptomyces sp. NBC_01233]
MPGTRIAPSWRAPSRTWTSPADTRTRYAEIPTPHGTYTLFREPGPRLSADAEAEARERWQFLLGGETVLEIDDAALPWQLIRTRLRRGVRGRLDGVPFTARAAGRSLLPGRRGIRFTLDDGRTLSFTAHPFHLRLVRETGSEDEVLARTRAGGWETDRLDRGELALLCFITVSGVDQLLTSALYEVFQSPL